MVLKFLELNNNWQNSYDHNQLRISRIIQSLRLLVSNEEADKFYKIILGMLKANNQVNNETLEFGNTLKIIWSTLQAYITKYAYISTTYGRWNT